MFLLIFHLIFCIKIDFSNSNIISNIILILFLCRQKETSKNAEAATRGVLLKKVFLEIS